MQQAHEFVHIRLPFVAYKQQLRLIMVFGLFFCVAATLLSACSGGEKANLAVATAQIAPALTHVLRRGLPGEPHTLDPHKADDTFSLQVIRDLYEGLTSIDSSGDVKPGIAASWIVDASGTVYTFAIRPTAKWSDGDSVVASEFVAGLRLSVDPKSASGSAPLLSVIKNCNAILAGKSPVSALGVSALDDFTLRVELERPAPFVLQILAEPIAAPLHMHRSDREQNATISDPKLTDGPYFLKQRLAGSFMKLERNPHYWDVKSVQINEVRYITVESEATELREYLADQIDLTYTVPEADVARLSASNASELQSAPILGTLYLALNLSKPPFQNNRQLRQALSMALDRDAIARYLTLDATPAFAFVAPGIRNYAIPLYSWSTWSRERQLTAAKALFASSGFGQSHPLKVRLYFNSGESNQKIMVAVAAQWKEALGVETKLESEEFRVFLNARKDHLRWDAVRLGWWADYNDPSAFLEIFAKGGVQNDPEYSNPDFNRSMEEARVEASPERRTQLLTKSEEILLADYPIIPVYFYAAKRLVKPFVGGAKLSALNRTYSKDLFFR